MLLSNNPDILALLGKYAHLQSNVNPMMVAIDIGAIGAVKDLFRQGVSIDGALLYAVKQGQTAHLRALLELPFGSHELQQAVDQACQMHSYDVMQVLKEFQR